MGSSSEFDALPKEIIPEILSRLPLESLFRLKTLNKSWYFFIRCLVKDPEFVSKHLRHAESSPTLLLVRQHPEEKRTTLDKENELCEFQVLEVQFGIGDDDDDAVHCIVKDFNLPHALSVILDDSVRGYFCDGIVCIVTDDWTTFNLYNPALGEYDSFSPSSRFNLDTNEVAGMGFGCDTAGSVYKVVRFFENMKAEVFVPGGPRNSWREIDMDIGQLPFHLLEFAISHVYLKGNCFWSMDDRIFCFDVGREVFHNVPLPEEATDHRVYSFCRCNGSIFVMLGSEDATYMWLLDVSCCRRGGWGYSWKRKSQIDELNGALWTVWDVDRGEVLVSNEDEEIESYNIFEGRVRSIPFKLTCEGLHYLEHYVESLVSIKRLNKTRLT